MEKQRLSLFCFLRMLAISGLTGVCLGLTLFVDSVHAELSGLSERPEERELFNTLPGNNSKGTILDATNPMDLMNRLRRATALDNATSPSDAVDEALKALESDEQLLLQ